MLLSRYGAAAERLGGICYGMNAGFVLSTMIRRKDVHFDQGPSSKAVLENSC